jgi:NADH:ubiquinone oxidoreductase subunit 5 (subunit L)/multisubunit Na+/H+ antiporter MnhA subunit
MLTAGYASLVGRTRCDAKTTLAYATMAQVGVIFVEIGLGLHTLALVHLFAHAGLRTWQFLRSSSLIQDFQDNPLYGRGDTRPPLLVRLLSTPAQRSLWLAAARQFWLDGAQQAFVARPFTAIFRVVAAIEDRILSPGVTDEEPGPRSRVAAVVVLVASAAMWWSHDPVVVVVAWGVTVVAFAAATTRPSAWIVIPGVTGLLLVLPGVAGALPTGLRALLLAIVAGVVPGHLWLEELRRRVPGSIFMVFLVARPGTALVWHVITSSPPPPAVADVFAAVGVFGAVAHAGLALVRQTASRGLVGIVWSQHSMILAGLVSGHHGIHAARLMVVACLLGSLVLVGGSLHLRRRFHIDALAPDNGLAARAPMLTAAMFVSGWIFVGLPGGLTFFAEDLLFHALFEQSPGLVLALVATSGLNAIAFYRVAIGLCGGVARPEIPRVGADPRVERGLMLLTVVAVALGLMPGLIAGH